MHACTMPYFTRMVDTGHQPTEHTASSLLPTPTAVPGEAGGVLLGEEAGTAELVGSAAEEPVFLVQM